MKSKLKAAWNFCKSTGKFPVNKFCTGFKVIESIRSLFCNLIDYHDFERPKVPYAYKQVSSEALQIIKNTSLKGISGKSWQFEQQVYDENGLARTIKASEGSGNMPKVINNLRIRKLTPKECFRLMGVKDEDYERIAANQSNASLYHLAGDSIVVNVLMAIFKEMI